MFKSVACVVVMLVSTVAHAAPPLAKGQEIQEAVKREELIKRLSEPPKSVLNVCRGC